LGDNSLAFTDECGSSVTGGQTSYVTMPDQMQFLGSNTRVLIR